MRRILYKKRAVILLFLLAFSFSVSSAQKVSLDFNRKSLKTVLESITEQTGYTLAYSKEVVNLNERVTIRVIDAELTQVLDELLLPRNIGYEIKDNKIYIFDMPAKKETVASQQNQQQERIQIRGKVTDVNGEPIIGANIFVPGTTIGTVSDVEGNYVLSVPRGSVVRFSYLGYVDQEFTVAEPTTLNVQLEEEVQTLEELVVVGYGTMKKETLSGSIASIRADDITTTKTENLINNIQGKVPGLLIRQLSGEPGTFNNAISIRGYGEPMIVIDGIVRNGTADLAQLNSNDVESISILKDASASIYGLGAANGVIIVTTKQGMEGKPQISYSGMIGVKSPTAIEPTVDAVTYYKLANEININDKQPIVYSDEFIQKYINKEPGYIDHDWYNLFMKDHTTSYSHNLSVRGGSKGIKYFTSLGYDTDEGLLKSDIQYYHRYNIRGTITANPFKNFELKLSTYARIDDTRHTREDFIWNYKTLLVNERGKGWHTIANEKHFTDLAPESKNIAALIDPDVDGYNLYRNRRYQTTLDLKYDFSSFVRGLSLGVSGAFDSYSWHKHFLQKSYPLYDYYTDAYSKTFGRDQISLEMRMQQRVYGRVQVNYSNTWNTVHNINATVVSEFDRSLNDYLSGARDYAEFFTKDMLDMASASTATNSGNQVIEATAAYLGRINYDYGGKYLLEMIGRYDGTYRYAPGKRWAFFPSLSVGWRISEEPFIKNNLDFVNNIKIRASRGKTGRNTGPAFEYVAGYVNDGSYTFDGKTVTTGMSSRTIVSDRLTWITSKTSNIGIDWDFWKGKFGGSFDVFERENTGILASRQQSIPTDLLGARFSQENINSDLNHGFEIALTHANKVNNDFSYAIGANFTYARRKNLHVEADRNRNSSMDIWINGSENRYAERYSGSNSAGNWNWIPGILTLEGGSYQSLEEYETAPLFNHTVGNSMALPGSWKIKDLNGDGLINVYDVTFDHGAVGINPPIQFGVNFSFNYKDIDMNMLIQGASGHSIQWKMDDIWGYGRYPTTYKKYLDRWHTYEAGADPFDPETKWISGYWPALRSYDTYNNYTLDAAGTRRQIVPGTYVRLKNFEIGYTVKDSTLKRIGLENCRIFISGYNLFTICNPLLKGADPERIEGDWNAGLTYPLMRIYNMGINLNF